MHGMEPAINRMRLPFSQMVHQFQVYDVSFLRSKKRCPCPFLGFLHHPHTWNGLRSHFNRQNWEDRIRIL